ncbi:MAG: PQQ-binding-like beta-propeller repeat protein, partial [Candidatus Tumulicola sp.]
MFSAYVASALLACCGHRGGAALSAAWPQPGMSETHAAHNALETTLGAGNLDKLRQLWSFPTRGTISAPIVVQGATAFVSSADGFLYAVNARTGAQMWKFQTFTDGQTQDAPIVSGERVFVACLAGGKPQHNGMCALRISNGRLAWSYFRDCECTPAAGLAGAPVVLGATLLVPYYQSAGGKTVLQVVNGDTGKPLWQYAYPGSNGGGPSPAAPAIANG